MRILVVGGGGREHALAWKLASDSSRPEVFCAPGNGGTCEVATNLPVRSDDLDGLMEWARANRPDLTVVGPEAPLCAGLGDRFEAAGLRVFGPRAAAARLEGSKVFAKEVMQAAGVPTARAMSFADPEQALQYVAEQETPLVVKADGLAGGKGVLICATRKEAEAAVRDIMTRRVFGEAGNRVVIEQFLEGEEASVMALVDGERVALLASSQDHKRLRDHDQGPNTGGMGAYSPAPIVTPAIEAEIRARVFTPVLSELRRRGISYRGVLYAGMMIGRGGEFWVLEFNCRFGDPETQAVIPRLDGDLAPALLACADGRLDENPLRWRREACVCVVMASAGYPGPSENGLPIRGLEEAGRLSNVLIFHAGTARRDGGVVTAGGRVLGVTALGSPISRAVRRAYGAVLKISFDGAQYRSDIARRATRRG